jgi:anti-anti-sigma factor
VQLSTTRDSAGQLVICVEGDVDLAVADQMRAACDNALGDCEQVLRIDLSGVSFIDSTGLGTLVLVHNAAQESGKHLVLVSPSERVRRLLEITGMTDVFQVDALRT